MKEPIEGKFTVKNTKYDWNYNYTSLKTALKKLQSNGELFVHTKGSYTRFLITDWYPEMKYLAGYYAMKRFGLKPFNTKEEAIEFLEKEIKRFKEECPYYNSEAYVFIEVK